LPSSSWRQTVAGRHVGVKVGQTSTADVGITQTARIYGTAFFDANGNGAPDTDERGFGATVFVDLNNNRLFDEDEPQAEIGFSGSWSLPRGLDPGTYAVRLNFFSDRYVATSPSEGVHRVTLRAGQERKLDLGFVTR
jgi:hypothetical protein